MKTYIGTKKVKAEPMSEMDAFGKGYTRQNKDNHDWRKEGYHVQYANADGTTYDSWSPKEVFEKAYHIADTYIDRMEIELNELGQRIVKATEAAYCYTVVMNEDERNMLLEQLSCMRQYADMLRHRIRYAYHREQIQNEGIEAVKVSSCGQ